MADRPSVHLCSVTTHAIQGKEVDASYCIHKMEIIINSQVVIFETLYEAAWRPAHNLD